MPTSKHQSAVSARPTMRHISGRESVLGTCAYCVWNPNRTNSSANLGPDLASASFVGAESQCSANVCMRLSSHLLVRFVLLAPSYKLASKVSAHSMSPAAHKTVSSTTVVNYTALFFLLCVKTSSQLVLVANCEPQMFVFAFVSIVSFNKTVYKICDTSSKLVGHKSNNLAWVMRCTVWKIFLYVANHCSNNLIWNVVVVCSPALSKQVVFSLYLSSMLALNVCRLFVTFFWWMLCFFTRFTCLWECLFGFVWTHK